MKPERFLRLQTMGKKETNPCQEQESNGQIGPVICASRSALRPTYSFYWHLSRVKKLIRYLRFWRCSEEKMLFFFAFSLHLQNAGLIFQMLISQIWIWFSRCYTTIRFRKKEMEGAKKYMPPLKVTSLGKLILNLSPSSPQCFRKPEP